jgi:ribosomal protein L12E/L44/L45/RPP1/RPP2
MSISKAEHDELCCVYAGLLLFDDKVDITPEKLNKVITASGNSVDAYYPEFFAKYLSSIDLNAVLSSAGSGAAASGPVAAEPVKVEEKKDDKSKAKAPEKKKEEPKPVEEEEGGLDLFF